MCIVSYHNINVTLTPVTTKRRSVFLTDRIVLALLVNIIQIHINLKCIDMCMFYWSLFIFSVCFFFLAGSWRVWVSLLYKVIYLFFFTIWSCCVFFFFAIHQFKHFLSCTVLLLKMSIRGCLFLPSIVVTLFSICVHSSTDGKLISTVWRHTPCSSL